MILTSSIVGLFISLAGILLLAKADNARHAKEDILQLSKGQKQLILAVIMLPLLFYIAMGQATSLLIWIGGVSVIGWVVALLPKHWV